MRRQYLTLLQFLLWLPISACNHLLRWLDRLVAWLHQVRWDVEEKLLDIVAEEWR